jgi:hypothetical protein
MYLSGAIKKQKPQMLALEAISLYDKIDCRENCDTNNVVGVIPKESSFSVLQSMRGKTTTVLRVESGQDDSYVAGWATYNETTMQKIVLSNNDTQNAVAE